MIADLVEHAGRRGGIGSVRAVDSFVPLGTATSAVLVDTDQIVAAAVALAGARDRAAALA